MEDNNNKNVIKLEYLPLKHALELYEKGVFVKGILPDTSNQDLSDIDEDLKQEFLSYYCSNLENGIMEYDMSMNDYIEENIFDEVVKDDEIYNVGDITQDELGYNFVTGEGQIVNYNNEQVYENEEQYNKAKRDVLEKSKKTLKTIGSIFAAPLTRYVTMKAKRVPDIDDMLKDGLYHFTSPKAADKIMGSGCIKASSRNTSYSTRKKTFFFGKNPELQDVLYNCKELQKNLTAIHVKYNEALQRDVQKGLVHVRLDDGAICIVGDTKEEYGYEMEKVQMELVKDKDKFYYKNITENPLTQEEIEQSSKVDEKLNRYLKLPKGLRELITYPEVASRAVSRFFNEISNKDKQALLSESKEKEDIKKDIQKTDILSNLETNTCSQEEVDLNYNNVEANSRQISKEENYI